MRLTAGTRLGSYEVVAAIGADGMGGVYRARDPRLDREVALKVLPEDAMADPDRARRFEQEARAVAALNHPNILRWSPDGRALFVSKALSRHSRVGRRPDLRLQLPAVAVQLVHRRGTAVSAGRGGLNARTMDGRPPPPPRSSAGSLVVSLQ